MKMRAKNPVSSEGDVKGYAGFGAMIASQQLTTPTIEGILEVLFGPGINSEDRLDVLLALTRRKPTEVFWPVLHTAWANCDDTWHLRSRLLKELRSRNGHMAGVNFLSMEDRAFLDNLPDPACVFRGCSKERARGPAWTTDWKIAAGFARGHRGLGVPRPIIATALVYKSDVFSICTERKESEVLLDPHKVEQLKVLPAEPRQLD